VLLGALLVGAAFGFIAWLAGKVSAAVCKTIVPFEDGPPPGKPPVAVLVALVSILGFAMAYRGATPEALLLGGFLYAVLVAVWASDVTCGIIPDWFTLVPLVIVTALRVALRQWEFIAATLLVALPFAIMAMMSKGRGMGWGDVKLAALGGAALGTYLAMWTFMLASLIAVIVARLRRRSTEPIAFGPYLAGAIGIALATGVQI
jgi:prepilin signal peptidase PulO-like enzyme (type II secretory pathway)